MLRVAGIALTALLASSCVVVVTSDCHDGLRNGSETDIDCGGDFCGPCGAGGFCSLNRDCVSGFCAAGVCAGGGGGPSCADGVKNGNETDVDCGGGTCAACAGDKVCKVNADCSGQVCAGGLCVPHPTGAGITPAGGDIAAIKSGQGANTPTGGYGITASGVGAGVTFRLTALASSSSQEFYGSIFSAGGLSGVNLGCGGMCTAPATTDFVSQPYLAAGGSRIDFDIFGPNVTGFDFDVGVNSQATPVIVDLYVNGVPVPQSTNYFNADTLSERSATTMPFQLFSK